MGLIREPIDVDFSIKSEPWTEEELIEFRKLMSVLKARKPKLKLPKINKLLVRA